MSIVLRLSLADMIAIADAGASAYSTGKDSAHSSPIQGLTNMIAKTGRPWLSGRLITFALAAIWLTGCGETGEPPAQNLRQSNSTAQAATHSRFILEATPERAIQPRLVVDQAGTIHLLYFRKRVQDPRNREGDLYYRKRIEGAAAGGADSWSVPTRVSSQSFSFQDAVGRAGIAVDGQGGVHVVWFRDRPDTGYFYTRLIPGHPGFEAQREMVVTHNEGLDAGAEIAAEGMQVAIIWAAGDLQRESERTIYMRHSADGGGSFGEEIMLGDPALGACACCALAAEFSAADRLHVAYRSAINNGGRHMQLLTVNPAVADQTHYRPATELQQWEIHACPVSTNDLLRHDSQMWLSFETRARAMLEHFDPASGHSDARTLAVPLTETRQKNSTLAINAKGEILVVWGEAISYSRGGALNLILLDADNHPLPVEVPDITIQDFSFPAVAALPDNRFLILY
jgi:hypothetical protein